MEIDKITEKIIGCAFTVYNELGSGFLESIYEKAMMIELNKVGLIFKNQLGIKVYYKEQVLGEFKADFLVENEVIVELKAVSNIKKEHEIQLIHYLTATKKKVGLLINFGSSKVEIRRRVK
jgi:GxxExxY protein